MNMTMLLELNCSTDIPNVETNFWRNLSFVIATFGIIGNLLSICILVKKEFRETFHRLLLSLAMVDALYLISVISRIGLRSLRSSAVYRHSQYHVKLNSTLNISNLDSDDELLDDSPQANESGLAGLKAESELWTNVIDLFNSQLRFMYFASIYFIVAISCERYFGVCYPIQSRVKGRKRFLLYLFPVLILSFLIELPSLVITLKHIFQSPFTEPLSSILGFWLDYLKPFFTIYLPLVLLIVLNIRVFFTIRNSRKSLRTNQTNDKERSFATILVSIVLLFLFTHSLRVLDQLYRSSSDNLLNHCRQLDMYPLFPGWLKTMFMLVEPAGMINASVNFVIYCLAGTRFRTALLRSAQATFRRTTISSTRTEYLAMSVRHRGRGDSGKINKRGSSPNEEEEAAAEAQILKELN